MRFRNGLCLLLFLMLASCFSLNGCVAFCESAPAQAEEADSFHRLATLDHSPYGVRMKLVDYADNRKQNEFLQDDSGSHGQKAYPRLLSGFLGKDGYPTSREGVSLAVLFADAVEVNHLFSEAAFLTDGVLEFDSTQCFASLQGERFTVYRELGTIDESVAQTMDHGQFLPFNDLTPGLFSILHPTNERDALGNPLPAEDPRKGEPLYAVPGAAANHFFGLETTLSFTCPAEGTEGRELVADFAGDDDLWVYVDGMLVLDLGGVHSGIPGSINFTTGYVTYRGSDGKDYTVKLYKLFRQGYADQHPEAREKDIQAYMDGIFRENQRWQMVFRDDSVHTMRIFYMERGAGAAALRIRLNMPLAKAE